MRKGDVSRHAKMRKGKKEIDVDGLALVYANPGFGTFNIDLIAIPRMGKRFGRNDFRRQKHPYWKSLLDGRAMK
jgi:hypothetical protein